MAMFIKRKHLPFLLIFTPLVLFVGSIGYATFRTNYKILIFLVFIIAWLLLSLLFIKDEEHGQNSKNRR